MTDLDKLQGAWNVATVEVDGGPMAAPSEARIVIEGRRFQSLGMGAVYEGTVDLDARKRPKTIDMIFTAGPEKGNRTLGIYELRGDRLTLCLTVTGKRRPKSFATTPGSGLALETLTRGATAAAIATAVSVDVPPESSATDAELAPEIDGEWQMTACVADGHPVPESIVKTGRRTARNGQTESWFGAQRLMKATYRVDRSAIPHTIDYTLKNGQQQFGIWKFEGGILHICFAAPGAMRPAGFEAGKGTTWTSWKRTGS